MARIPLDPPRTVVDRVARWYSRRSYGAELDPAAAMGHHPGVLLSSALQEGALARCHRLDPTLKALAVMASAATPPAVTDEMVAGLRPDLDDAALVELTMMVAVENSRSQFDAALGLTGQGFRDRCEVPAA